MYEKKIYITTPLYYVNAKPHLGHAYTQVVCDTVNRFFKLLGYKTYFMTGTDEHGEKIEEAAVKAGYKKEDVKKFIDSVVPSFKELWERLNIKYDFFIRTTDFVHEKTVKYVLETMSAKGDIYKGRYKGWFCTPCESFWSELEIDSVGKCPDCKRTLTRIEEENYFFKLSKYQRWLISYIEKNKDFIKPDYRRNEILSFLKNPLQDLCISRPKSRMQWGIEIPFDPDYVVYVWFDALINYISGCGFLDNRRKFRTFWPADFHIIGKDILRHHAIYWPIILHSIGVTPPKTIFAHGWWIVKGEKMSKSKGNIVDPHYFISNYGTDAFRYFLLREVTFGMDGTFSEEGFISRFNSDLANDLGNLVNRTLTMVEKYFEGKIPNISTTIENYRLTRLAENLKGRTFGLKYILEEKMLNLDFSNALSSIWDVINVANKFIEQSQPWSYARRNERDSLGFIIVSLLEVLRIVSVAMQPFIPETAEKIWRQLGIEEPIVKLGIKHLERWALLKNGVSIRKERPLFPRIPS